MARTAVMARRCHKRTTTVALFSTRQEDVLKEARMRMCLVLTAALEFTGILRGIIFLSGCKHLDNLCLSWIRLTRVQILLQCTSTFPKYLLGRYLVKYRYWFPRYCCESSIFKVSLNTLLAGATVDCPIIWRGGRKRKQWGLKREGDGERRVILHDGKKGRANVNNSITKVRNGHRSIIVGSVSRGDGGCNTGRGRFEEQWMSG